MNADDWFWLVMFGLMLVASALGVFASFRISQRTLTPTCPNDQPAPIPNDKPAVWDLVMADMKARDELGKARYGTRLQPHNGRDALRDAYEEALDLAVYLRQLIFERGEA